MSLAHVAKLHDPLVVIGPDLCNSTQNNSRFRQCRVTVWNSPRDVSLSSPHSPVNLFGVVDLDYPQPTKRRPGLVGMKLVFVTANHTAAFEAAHRLYTETRP